MPQMYSEAFVKFGGYSMSYELTKSKYCKGVQCPKILWMDEHHPELAEIIENQTIMETGVKVGELARSYFGKYELVKYSSDKTERTDITKELMKTADNIAEACFSYDSLFCAVDILHRNGDGWDIVEVKSSTEIAEVHLDDIAFQYYVLLMCKVNVKGAYILHIDNTYVREEKLDINRLFMLENCTDIAIRKFYEMQEENRLAMLIQYVKHMDEPVKDIDLCCDRPYECAYKKYCGKHIPEHSVFDLVRMQSKKKYELYHEGILSYEDVLKNTDRINEKQKRQVESWVYDKADEYDIGEIKAFLDTLSYPIYHLDFETFQQAIPEFIGCRPYEQIPFQYSLHIEYEDGRLEHLEFLAKEGEDPRRALAEQLVHDIPKGVCSTAYNMSFERTVLKHLAEEFPDLSEHLMDIYENMHDLMVPFQKQYYYSKNMQGSYSIKYVLPALWPGDPELDYHNLEGVHNGAEASATFADMQNHSTDEIRVMRENLLKYCGLDTFAMVKVLRKLKEVVEKK